VNVPSLQQKKLPLDRRLSIIMPVRDGQRYIRAALDSVACQCSEADELIVIDDGSTDQTADIVNAFWAPCKIMILKAHGKGPAKARNLGLVAAQGRLITFLDHDDYWPSHRIESHIDRLDSDPSIAVTMSKVKYFLSPDSAKENETRTLPEAIYHVHLGASTFRRSVFENVGGFDEDMKFSEDHDLFLRIREVGLQIAPIDEIGLYYRIHDTNMTRDQSPEQMRYFFEVVKKSLSRRREQRQVLSEFPRNPVRKTE
jgi:glycosyltransferase involved in cell wall biosynthesis